ncbi:hypothetical protein BIW11_13776 [Tropilaelaps mercedesae]|uniref:Uncharacterized protein n=1 Tax=Tropilaelaps mercedesae TaxID=418985 RepID=A0A1V9X0D1_9ACAR|nr:hypothetical protein BIW11_13776 [Tropilaelaps mercedesae]
MSDNDSKLSDSTVQNQPYDNCSQLQATDAASTCHSVQLGSEYTSGHVPKRQKPFLQHGICLGVIILLGTLGAVAVMAVIYYSNLKTFENTTGNNKNRMVFKGDKDKKVGELCARICDENNEDDYLAMGNLPLRIHKHWSDYKDDMSLRYAENAVEPRPMIHWPDGEFERPDEGPDTIDDDDTM